eukprot:TRINITY_DN4409_c0_g1_i5.p1 TRINITY_DN4409_c0_g1~~TRINITY_DN4409_c0_g1_i5.p1  ORF type:complete len:452 (+),score=65.25 TRINITY_DN4409_c0_g1_i5:52-1356(+)
MAGDLQQELQRALCEARERREQCGMLQGEVERLNRLLAQQNSAAERVPQHLPPPPSAGAAQLCSPQRDPQCGRYVVGGESPTQSPRRQRCPAAVAPPPPPHLHPPAPTPGAQMATWRDFVAAARRFRLTERDLLLVSAGTLRQLIAHCGFGGHPVDVARIELQWRQLNEGGAQPLSSPIRNRSPEPAALPPPPEPLAPPAREQSRCSRQSASGRRARSAGANSRCSDSADKWDLDFVPQKKPSLSRRADLSRRAASTSDPNLINPGRQLASGRRSASPDRTGGRLALPPYGGDGRYGDRVPLGRGGIVTSPYDDRHRPTFERCQNHTAPPAPSPSPRMLRSPVGRSQGAAGCCNPNHLTAGRKEVAAPKRGATKSPSSQYEKIRETEPGGTDYGCGRRLLKHRAKRSTGDLLRHDSSRSNLPIKPSSPGWWAGN